MPPVRGLDPAASSPVTGIARPGQAARRRAWPLTGWRREVALFALAYLAYQAARVAVRGDVDDALTHARWVVDAQRAVGLDLEQRVQDVLLGTPWMGVLDWVYLSAQTVALAGGLVLVYRANRRVFVVLRNTLLATWILALPVYALFPTAPPRLAGVGLVDSVTADTPFRLAAGSTTLLFNPYAAVPSLHAGFAVALGLAVARTARSRSLRIAGLAWGPLVIVAVLATGNHFVFDVAAGLALTGVGLAFALLIAHLRSTEQSPAATGPWRQEASPAPAASRRASR